MGLGQLIGVSFRFKDKQEDKNRIKIPITNIVHGPGFPFIGDQLYLGEIPLATILRRNEVYDHLYSEGIPLDRVSEEDRKYLERAKSAIVIVDMDPKTYELSYSVRLLYESMETHDVPVHINHQNPFDREKREKPTF